MGVVMSEDVTSAADKVADRMESAWTRIRDSVAPIIVSVMDAVLGLADAMQKPSLIPGLGWDPLGVAELEKRARTKEAASRAEPAAPQWVKDIQAQGFGAFGGSLEKPGRAGASGFLNDAETKYIANARLQAELAGLTAERRAQELATIGLANVKLEHGTAVLKDQDGHLIKQVSSYSEARKVVGDTAAKHIESLAATTAQAGQVKQVKETFTQYLGSLGEEVRIASLTKDKREEELAVIRGAQVLQKQRGDDERNLVKTYDDALKKLNAAQISDIERSVQAKQAAADRQDITRQEARFAKELTDQATLSAAAMAAGRDVRELALDIARKELDLGRQLSDVEKERLHRGQQQEDAVRLGDYIGQLKEEAQLAGLSADERERQLTVLAAMRITHGELNAEQARQISGWIEVRQETERWRDVVTPIAEFPSEFIEQNSAEIGEALQEIIS